jgi:hypothetical protein
MKTWTLYLVLPGRYGPAVSGLLTLLLLVAIQLALVGEIFWASTGLFFAATLAYLPAAHAYILGITKTAVHELAPNLSVSMSERSAILERMERPGWRLQLICLLVGSAAAIAHIQFMGFIPRLPDGSADFSGSIVKVSIMGTLLTWITMTTVISCLIQNNSLLSNLAVHMTPGGLVPQTALATPCTSSYCIFPSPNRQQCTVPIAVYRLRHVVRDEDSSGHDVNGAHRGGHGLTATEIGTAIDRSTKVPATKCH